MGRGRRTERSLRHLVAVRLSAEEASDAPARRRLAIVESDLEDDIGASVPKTSAARVLGVSTTTLQKWIERGMLGTVRGPNGREEIEAASLTGLCTEVSRLRELGQDRAVLAAAFNSLAERDPRVRRALEENVGEGLQALRSGLTHELSIPSSFGAED